MSSNQAPDTRSSIAIRILTPDNCKIFTGVFSLLHAYVEGDDIGLYRGIYAVMAFPVSAPDHYISLRYMDTSGVEHELGVIIDPKVFPQDAQGLLRESLARHYFENQIVRIYGVEWKYGLLFFDVETAQGRKQFQMRWQVDRAQDYGEHSKVLLDVHDNRFIIPDLRDLPRQDRERLTRYIYW